MGRTCPFCNSSEIEEDSTRGDATCMSCGTVLEESTIVSDIQFQERGGGHEIVGQFVSRDRAQPSTLMGVVGIPRSESREITFYKGKKLIQEVSSQLRINQHCMDIAFNFFKMCVSRNFTRGRRRSHVVVACLYMTCRLENTTHLLLDFSDVTQVNIFDLGRTLSFLTRSLKINLPTTDPCLYVLRFAVMLDLADKQKDIVSLATRIVQRMKRDWMSTGRRPTGLCGAALLLAARAYNMNRTIADIVRIVHISESVVRKRLDEFASTPSSALTIDEFATVDLEESEDPPAFQESKKKVRDDPKRIKEDMQAECVSKDIETVQKKIEIALKQKLKKSAFAKQIINPMDKDCDVPELAEAEQRVRDELIETVFDVADGSEQKDLTATNEINTKYGPSLTSLGILGPHASDEPVNKLEVFNESGNDDELGYNNNCEDLDLTGIDDDEINGYILNEVETSIKSRVWLARNGEHLVEVERRRKFREEEEEKNKDNPKKKRKITRRREPITAATHSEAIFQVIQERNLSSKINYDILREMENDDPVKDPSIVD